MIRPIHFNIPISKIDEEKRMVWGYATVEELDKHGEIIGYEASKAAFSNWVGNIRYMHDPTRAVGKGIEIEFHDADKAVWVGSKISESADGQNAWTQVLEGVLTGYSIGGTMKDFEMVKTEGSDKATLMITDYDLSEVSLVDNPACPSAVFQMVKSVAGGGLQRTETMQKGAGRPIHWWERAYRYSDSQVINKGVIIYNEDSMSKATSIQKDIWGAGALLYIARELAYYIAQEAYEGEPTDDLIAALQTLKAAAVTELSEDEQWPEPITMAIELATKTLNLSKSLVEEKMAKELSKTVIGQPDRDADGKEVRSAEENGKPVEEEKTDAELAEETDKAVDDAAADEEKPADEADKVEEPKKAAAATDISKATTFTLDDITSAVEKATAPLKERLDAIEKSPTALKGKGSFMEVEKSEKAEDQISDAQKELDEALARGEVLSKNASNGTPKERIDLVVKIRRLQRAMDPASVHKANAIRASFNEPGSISK